jgi:cell fate (sporulation/competence/biofilm development) regulator YlbF (YheA/YmcA/DUF963 family)
MLGLKKEKRKNSLYQRVRKLAAKVARKEKIAALKEQEAKLRAKLQKL